MPSLPPPLWAELFYDDAWNSITRDVSAIRAVTSRTGRSSERDSAGPSTGSLPLINREGKYSRRNPLSELRGKISLNTPVRYGVKYGSPWGVMSGAPAVSASYFSTPSTSGLNITNDLEVRAELSMNNWRRAQNIGGRYAAAGNRSWAITISSTGIISLTWSTNGTATVTASSTIGMPAHAGQRCALKVTLDVSNSDSVYEARFYTAKSADDPDEYWSLIGSPAIGAATTNVFNPTAVLEAGAIVNASNPGMEGDLYRLQLRDGIGGTVLADFDPSRTGAGATSFSDSTGKTWSSQGGATLSNKHILLSAEIPSWTPSRDKSGEDRRMATSPSGITRRLGSGNKVLRSSMFREMSSPSRANIVAYYPMEDLTNASSIASGLPNDSAGRATGAVTLAANQEWNASDALPTFTTGRIQLTPKAYTATSEIAIRALINVPAAGTASEVTLLSFVTTGTARTVIVSLLSTGSLRFRALNSAGVELEDSGAVAFAVNGETDALTIELSSSGATITYAVRVARYTSDLTISDTVSVSTFSDTFAGTSVGRVLSINVGGGGDLAGTSVGHLAVADALAAYSSTSDANVAWNGESAQARFRRLCTEEGVTGSAAAYTGSSALLGYQRSDALLDLLREVETADLGIFAERRDAPELIYRSSTTLWNQAPGVEVDFSAGLIDDLDPTDDDRAPFNEITAKRKSGSEYTFALETGTNSIADIGRYDTSVEVSLASDDDLPSQASMRVAMATVDEMRYPQVKFNLANERTAQLFDRLMKIDLGDKITLGSLPADYGPEAVELLVFGINDTISDKEWSRTLDCVPGSTWDAFVGGVDRYDRADTGGCTLGEDLTLTETLIDVVTATGSKRWVDSATYPAEFPFNVRIGGSSGETVRVTAISGTSSSQTFTAVRGINGPAITHVSGEDVRLDKPSFFAP